MTSYKNNHKYHRLVSDEDAPPGLFGGTGGKQSGNSSEWSRIDDLDQFFIQVYTYYDQKGLLCIAAREIFKLTQFAFIVFIALMMGVATNYHFILNYGTRNITDHTDINNSTHQSITYQYDGMSIFDAIDTSRFGRLSEDQVFVLCLCLFVASLFWLAHVIYSIRKVWHAFHIGRFYAEHLRITDAELPNKTWSDVVGALVCCQDELTLCVEKERLTELDIVHRILRRVNYLIALQNKGVIDHLYHFPLLGQRTFLTEGMRFNLKLILFSDPFATRWQLRDEYKRSSNRVALAERMSKRFFYIGLLNLILSPFVLLWQFLFSFFSYAEVIRRQPGTLGTRKWSHYSKLKLRHFNELDHELNNRLTFAYKPSKSYMAGFSSRIVAIIGECVAFFAGAILAILTVLTVLNENLIMSDHILVAYTGLIVIFTSFRMLIPDGEIGFDSKKSMEKVDRYLHYIPPLWRTEPHTEKVRAMFAQLFQYKVTAYLEELASPIVTPFLLMFCLRHRSLEIVNFYQRFTVKVEGTVHITLYH
jgi:autophagy-related protein 9